MKEFRNPWPLPVIYDKQTHGRITSDIPASEKMYWLSVDPVKGGQQTTVNILLEKLFHELKQLGYTDASRIHEVRSYIANVKLIDGRSDVHGSTVVGIVPTADASIDGRGTTSKGGEDKGVKNIGTDLSSKSAGRKTRNKGK